MDWSLGYKKAARRSGWELSSTLFRTTLPETVLFKMLISPHSPHEHQRADESNAGTDGRSSTEIRTEPGRAGAHDKDIWVAEQLQVDDTSGCKANKACRNHPRQSGDGQPNARENPVTPAIFNPFELGHIDLLSNCSECNITHILNLSAPLVG